MSVLISYEEYLKTTKSLAFEKMVDIHSQMLDEIGNDTDANELYDELIEKAIHYAAFRAEWFLWDKKTKLEKDASRSSCHNSLIIKVNALAKYLRMQGKAASWRDKLGYEEDDRYNRKTIGDFACYLVFIHSINAR